MTTNAKNRLKVHVSKLIQEIELEVDIAVKEEREIINSGHVPRKHWQRRVDLEQRLKTARILAEVIDALD